MSYRVSRAELDARITGLQDRLRRAELDGALLLQRADLIYYAGGVVQGALAVPARGESRLYVWRGRRRLADDGLTPEMLNGPSKLSAELAKSFGGWQRVGFEEDVLPVAWYRRIVKKTWPTAEHEDISPAIREQRAQKSEVELDWCRQAGQVLVAGFAALPEIIRMGMPEYEVRLQLDRALRRAGDQVGGRVRSFDGEAPGLVAYGASAAADIVFDGPLGHPGRYPYAPMGSSDRPVGRSLPIIVDVIAGVNGYVADMTRCFAFGELEARFVDAHALCVHICEQVTRRAVPGAVPEELYQWAVDEAEAAGFGAAFMNRGENRVRFLGHGVGLELDELPVLARRFTAPLAENMVVAIEPKVIFEDGAVGVEDTVIVKPGGGEVITEMDRGVQLLDEGDT